MTIKAKMIGAVIMILVLGCGAAFSLLIVRQGKEIFSSSKSSFHENVDSIYAALVSIMNTGDPKDVADFFQNMHKQKTARGDLTPLHISVTNKDNKVVWDNDPQRVGIVITPTANESFEEKGGYYRLSKRIPLTETCIKCHQGTPGSLMGYVDLEKSSTAVHQRVAANRNGLILFSLVLMLVIGGTVVLLLKKLVFNRIEQVIDTTTRVVGGEFEKPIVCTSSDEVGQLEQLLEQFRVVFVNTSKELEAKLEGKS